MITQPGVYDIPADQYHADPVEGGSLSSSGAKMLMLPNCPAMFKHQRDEGQRNRRAFDFGHAAHLEVLGAGEPLVIIDAADYKKKATQEARDAAYAAGSTPILAHEYEVVQAMAAALRRHRMASALLDPAAGVAEQTLVWRDRESGVMCRALVDFLRTPVVGQRLVVPDYKTATKVDPESISKALWSFGYYGQGAWYTDGVRELGLSPDGDAAFVLIFQQKDAPYLVVCAQVVDDSITRGWARNRKARDIYRTCTDTGIWPGFADDEVITVALPSYAVYQLDAALQLGHLRPEGSVV